MQIHFFNEPTLYPFLTRDKQQLIPIVHLIIILFETQFLNPFCILLYLKPNNTTF